MKKPSFLLLLAVGLWLCTLTVCAQTTVFDTLTARARQFAYNYPREKVFLHFDNTSYYQGDTIWYKAYAVNAADNRPSNISKPLYVELVDQLGHVMERQTIRLQDGMGHGQISLDKAFFTGYYEVRAYTRWMLAFGDDAPYFSRTLPVYRKVLNADEPTRTIATYNMDATMRQRPRLKAGHLTVRFFPEGGQLVQGIQTLVGMEALSNDSGYVDLEGWLEDADGKQLIPVATVHDGMGSFTYVPGNRPARVAFTFAGRRHTFILPTAAASGYSLAVNSRDDAIEATVTRSSAELSAPVAVMLFVQGVPYTCAPVNFGTSLSRNLRILTDGMAGGVVRLALVDAAGQTLADRFCYVYPSDTLHIDVHTDHSLYSAYSPVHCNMRITDGKGLPVAGAPVSVAVRTGTDTDYMPYDNTLYTDLLLTSNLKGYIHQPGFYFKDRTAGRRRMLDNLLLIRGWRSYNLDEAFGRKPFVPRYLPEQQLELHGHVDSWYGRSQAGIGVSVLAQTDSMFVSATVKADSLGNFTLPVDDFYGSMEALIQTRRDNKRYNRNSYVSLYRTFEPALRPFYYEELHPAWTVPADTTALRMDADAAQAADDTHLLDEVVIKGKRRHRALLKDTRLFERDILGFYQVRQYVERQRDEGKFVSDDLGYIMHQLNGNIDRDGAHYGADSLKYSANGQNIDLPYLRGSVDMVQTALIYRDKSGLYAYSFDKNFRVDTREMRDIYTHRRTADTDTMVQSRASNLAVRCDFTMDSRWNSDRNFQVAHGMRRTIIHGYNRPAQFYVPLYTGADTMPDAPDRRRTLLWNPSLRTDANGEVHVALCNGAGANFLNISVETLADGKPAGTV